MSTERLMIFAKAPYPGRVKTRLIPALGAEGASRLHAAFVEDVVARHRAPGRRITLWTAGDPAHPLWDRLDASRARQVDGDLGARLRAAFAAELTDEARVVVLGTDSPTLPPALVDAAFAALDRVPVVVGPACDGGYYLIGMRGRIAPVFDDVAWGTEAVLAQTLEALNAAGLDHALLDFWYDVDRPADLRLLRAVRDHLAPPLPTATLALLDALS